MKIILLVLMLAAFSVSQAASFVLDADGQDSVYKTTLPKSVYRYSTQSRLADLSVTNAAGQPVPYALAKSKHPIQKTTIKPLTIFPIQQLENSNGEVTQIELHRDADDTHLSVTSEDATATKQTYYLFDLGKKHQAFKTLQLDWQGQENQLLTVNVYSSDNLQDWQSISQAALLKTGQGEAAIVQNTVNSQRMIRERYLKIEPSDAKAQFNLTKANIQFHQQSKAELPLLWEAIPFGARNDEKGVTTIDFEALGHYPARFVNAELPDNNTITQVTIYTRNRVDQQWRRLKKTTLFKLNKNGKTHQNKKIAIPQTTARYWRLTFNQANGGIGQSPVLKLGWMPDTIVWNARGSAPYNLSLGTPINQSNTITLASLLKAYGTDTINTLPTANVGQLSGASESSTWASPHQDDKRIWLWVGLVLGVVTLGYMAYSLLKSK